jgi:peptide-methionine (S)-S-oxide reductase
MFQSIGSSKMICTGISFFFVACASLAGCAQQPEQSKSSLKVETQSEPKMKTEKAILAGGCFWGMEDLFRKQPGVVSTRVGYSGGDVKNATYRNHGTHAESIEVVFDPSKTDFRKMLEFFFQIHDPTTKNRQGNDVGTSYRSAIFYTSEEQKQVALDTIEDVNASGLWPGKVVTEVEAFGDFWEAEPEHQDYLVRYPDGYTCHFPRKNWVLPKRSSPK